MSSIYDQADYGRKTEFEDYPSIDLSIAQSAAQPLELDLHGRFIYLDDDTTGKVYIRFNDKNSHRFPLQAGAKYDNLVFNRVYLDWEAQAGKIVNIVYGQDANFTPTNDINNINQVGELLALPADHYRRSVLKDTFMSYAGYGPLAANYSVLQLWNPAGSGKNLAVLSMSVSLGAAGYITVVNHTASIGGGSTFRKNLIRS